MTPRLFDNSIWRRWWPVIVAAAIYTIVVVVIVVIRNWGVSGLEDYELVRQRTTSDFRDFWWTARHFRETGIITTEFGVQNYLPFFTILMLPWSLLPLPLAAGLFSFLSLALFGVAVALAESLLRDEVHRGPRRAMLIAVILMLPYVHACAVLGNVGLLLTFLIVTTWFLVERGREWEAGLALGLAALIKLLPALLIVYFLLKRRWRVAGAAVGVAIVLGFGAPLAAVGSRATGEQLGNFYKEAVAGHSAYRTIMAEAPRKAMYSNNALPIVLRRLLSHVNAGKGGNGGEWYVNILNLPRPAIVAIYAVIIAGLLAVSIVAALKHAQPWPPESIGIGRQVRAQFGAWCALMLLASPLLWIHYLPLVYWPLALVADRAERSRRARLRGGWLSLVALVWWLVALGLLAWPAARAAGAQLAAVGLLWLATVVWGWRGEPPPPARPPGPKLRVVNDEK